MTVKIKQFAPKDGIKARQHRKENHFNSSYAVIVYHGRTVTSNPHSVTEKFSTPIELRFYATKTTWYACLWINHEKIHASGSGKAGGYGYHKPSAAADEALNSAGIILENSISGAGDDAIREALREICFVLNISTYHIHYSHG